jgi:chromosome segregation ATPase
MPGNSLLRPVFVLSGESRPPHTRSNGKTWRRHSVDYLYSLYDALVSINVPNDKARAVVDAMERDMGTTLATKTDLTQQRLATKADLAELRSELKADLGELRSELKADLGELRSEFKADLGELRSELKTDMTALRSELKADAGELRSDFAELRSDFTALRGEVRHEIALVRKDMEILGTTISIRLGSVLVVGLGIIFAALRLT